LSGLLDASVLVRYLTGDPPEDADEAARIIESEEFREIAPVTLAEVGFVLTSVYKVPRDKAVDELVRLLQKRNLSVIGLDKGLALQALLLCRPSGRVSFADALVWATARATTSPVYTFDQRFPGDGIEVRHRG